MTIKKATLKGRKRITELGESCVVAEKKAELLAMQVEGVTVTGTREQSVTLSNASSKSNASPKKIIKNMMPQEPQSMTFRGEDSIHKLVKLYKHLSSMGTAQRRHYSAREVNLKLQSELKEMINQHAEQLKREGFSFEEIKFNCQQTLDHWVSLLAEQGVFLGKLGLKATMSGL